MHVNTDSYTTFVIYVIFSLNSVGEIGTVQIFTPYSIMPDMINNCIHLLLSDKLRFSVPFKFKVFALIIVQNCSMMIIAA